MKLIGRRNFLAAMGLGAGAPLLGSIFHANLLPEALGQTPRKRFIIFTNANGFVERNYTCTARSEVDFDLAPAYDALAPYKAQMVIASKFYNPHDRALHGNQWATLSVMASPNQTGEKRGPPGGISIDRFLAKEIGSKDPFPSTAVGLAEGTNILCVSCDGLNQPFPAIGSPVKAYQTFFGSGMVPAGGAPAVDTQALLAQDKSLLDLISGDVKRMQGRLAGPERAKLDQYLTSLQGVERQLAELGKARTGCQPPTPLPATLDKANLDPKIIAAHVDVTFAAQLCGLTRVSHISILGMEGPHNGYGFLGMPGENWSHHQVHHGGDQPKILKIDQFVLSNVALMVERLAKTPEGNGTMLDNSLVVYINSCGGKHHGGQDNHAVVMVGKAGGTLRTGRYMTFAQKQHCISDVFVSMANMFGVPITKFGDPMHCKGPLPGLV